MFREAWSGDFETAIRLYRQLQPEDPIQEDGKDGSDVVAFEQILSSTEMPASCIEAKLGNDGGHQIRMYQMGRPKTNGAG